MSHRRGIQWSSAIVFSLSVVGMLALTAYLGAMVLLRASPAIVAVAGVSMTPTFQNGDLLLLHGAEPEKLVEGDIVAVVVPEASQQAFGLPSHVVHRIVKIEEGAMGPLFTTKGDANSGPDAFVTRSSGIVGQPIARVAGLGYPILFLRSGQGQIFVIATAVVIGLYVLLGFADDWRRRLRSLDDIALTLATRQRGRLRARSQEDELNAVLEQARDSALRSAEVAGVVRELVLAIGEYGRHLASHTAVMQNLAATTNELRQVTLEMRQSFQTALAGVESPQQHMPARVVEITVGRAERAPGGSGTSRALAELRQEALDATKAGRRPVAIGLLRVVLAIDPLDLAAHRRLAAALMLAGDRAAAAYEYERFARLVRQSPGGSARAELEIAYAKAQLGDRLAIGAGAA